MKCKQFVCSLVCAVSPDLYEGQCLRILPEIGNTVVRAFQLFPQSETFWVCLPHNFSWPSRQSHQLSWQWLFKYLVDYGLLCESVVGLLVSVNYLSLVWSTHVHRSQRSFHKLTNCVSWFVGGSKCQAILSCSQQPSANVYVWFSWTLAHSVLWCASRFYSAFLGILRHRLLAW